MTEFAISLPVYVVFMIGILNVYHIQQEALLSEQRASADLWDSAIDVQDGSLFGAEMTPATGAASAGAHYGAVDKLFTTASVMDMTTALGGIYADSGAKTTAANAIPTVNVDPDPQTNLTGVVCNPSFTRNLMDDRMRADEMNFDNFAGIASSILNASGTRPALAAGIRYGNVGGIDDHDFGSDSDAVAMEMAQAFTANVQTDYVASAPPRPVDRLAAVGLARLEIGTEDGYSDTANFGWSHIGSGADSIGSCP